MEGVYMKGEQKWSMVSQIFAGYLLVIATTGFARLAYGVLMPYIQSDLKINYTQAGLLATIISLGFLIISPISGILAIKFGMKKVIMAGAIIVTSCFFLLLITKSFYGYMLIMFFCGAGSALAFTPLMSLLVVQFPKKKGLVLGVLLSGVGSGMLLSGLMTTYLIKYFQLLEWRAIWLIFAGISLMVSLLAWFVLKEPVSIENTKGNANHSITNVYKNWKIIRIGLIYFLIGVGYLIPILFQTSFMLDSGINDKVAGTLFSISGLFTIIGGPVWGLVSDKVGRKLSILVGLTFCILAGIIPITDHHLVGFAASAILFGFSIGGLMVLIQAMAAERTLPYFVPAVLGFVTIFYAIGQLVGPLLTGVIIEKLGGIGYAYKFATLIFIGALCIVCFVNEREKVESA
jgi:MFS family permease